jgi:hypothetical protein
MAEFDSIQLEIYINGAWLDIWDDVLHSPAPASTTGIMGSSALDRVGDAGQLTFYLRNDASNSAGIAGYYSPNHANSMPGWTTGLKIRHVFTFDGVTKVKFYGKIASDGITPDSGIYGRRRTKVVAEDWMAMASDHELNLLELQENYTIDQAVSLIVANMPVVPLSTSYAVGSSTFPTVFDATRTGTRAISEFQKLALSEFGYIYIKRGLDGETLIVESRDTRSNVSNTVTPIPADESSVSINEDDSYLLNEDDTSSVLDESQALEFDNENIPQEVITSYGKNLANKIIATSYPRKVDTAATTVLFALQSPFKILAGGTKEGYRGSFRDPAGGASYVNGKEMVTPVSGTDYAAFANEDGTGTDYTANLVVTATYGTNEVEYTLTNNASVDIWVTVLQARGKGIYLYDPVTTIKEDLASQVVQGVLPLRFDMIYQDDPTTVDAFSEYTLGLEKDPNLIIDSYPVIANRNSNNMLGFMYLEPGARARFKEGQIGIDSDYFIQGYKYEVIDGKIVIWQPVLKSAASSSFWIWDTSEWDVSTTWSFPS